MIEQHYRSHGCTYYLCLCLSLSLSLSLSLALSLSLSLYMYGRGNWEVWMTTLGLNGLKIKIIH